MDNINMKYEIKYITVLDFEDGKVYQYKVSHKIRKNKHIVFDYEEYIGWEGKGHNLNNCQWMVHDIKEIVDHTIKSTIEKDK